MEGECVDDLLPLSQLDGYDIGPGLVNSTPGVAGHILRRTPDPPNGTVCQPDVRIEVTMNDVSVKMSSRFSTAFSSFVTITELPTSFVARSVSPPTT